MTDLPFEKAMSKLENIVQELEAGEITLEKALKKFEEGVKLSRYCEKKLDESEARITWLTRQPDGQDVETEIDAKDLNLPEGDQ